MLDCSTQLSFHSPFPSVEGILEPILKDKGILYRTKDSLWRWLGIVLPLWSAVCNILSSVIEGALCFLNESISDGLQSCSRKPKLELKFFLCFSLGQR